MATVANVTSSNQQEFMRKTGQSELDKHAFLELMITQLRYQDPLNPTDNSEFLAQMAQFTSLEQVQNISAGLDRLLVSQTQHQSNLLDKLDALNANMEDLIYLTSFAQFSAFDQELLLLGNNVTVKTKEGQEVTGSVTAVRVEAGGNVLVINDQPYYLSQVVRVHGGEQLDG